MARKWYGSLNNRIEENRMFCEEIKIGTGMTEYSWSDRHPYEVIAVKDQKHVTVRKLDHKHVGDGCMDNSWELVSNPNNPTYEMVRRGDRWYSAVTITREEIESRDMDSEDGLMFRLWMAGNDFDINKVMEKGHQTKYRKMNVSFGTAQYYYDYEF